MSKLWALRVLPLFLLLGFCRAQVCSSAAVPLNVFTRQGRVVLGVLPDRLQVKVHGQAGKINSFSFDVSPRRVVLLLDTSGSMAGRDRQDWRKVSEMFVYALETIPPDASVAIGTFGELPRIGNFGTRAQGEAGLDALTRKSFYGRTPLFDAIHLALLKLNPPRFGDVIYLVTDAGNNSSKLDRGRIERELVEHGTRLFVLLLTRDVPRTEEERDGPESLSILVSRTGGRLVSVWAAPIDRKQTEALMKIAPLIRSQIAGTYHLGLSFAKAIAKPAPFEIRYLGPDKKAAKSLYWTYPDRVACPALGRP